MTPEERARAEIDRQLTACGWVVQDRAEMDIYAAPGVAVREFPLQGGEEADYLLYAYEQAIGVVEAKPEGFTLHGVEAQSAKYAHGLSPDVPAYRLPLPFLYESTGKVTQFTNGLEPEPRSREVFAFHRPEELLRLVGLDRQLRGALRALPPLEPAGLWPAQITAIENLETSLRANRPRALVQMATGSGKTFTAVSAIYRLVKYAGARRVLFLVDRANLGRQTYREFQQYVSPYNGLTFTDEYNVQLLRSNTLDPVSRVCITTVQRLYSMLKGEDAYDEGNEEGSQFEADASLVREPVPVAYNGRIPIEAFDVIVVDECHRSIYNLWRQVLEYFDAFIVGLTATPSKSTVGFFGGNLVMEYNHARAVADGVNVDFDVYRIRTRVTERGATLTREPGYYAPYRHRRTRVRRRVALDDDLTYSANRLDRDVVSEDQIRLVLRTFRDRLPEIFPGRTEVPKTLIFAKDDSHAEDITRQARLVFDKGNDFCQKITYKTTGVKPEDLLAQFRNSYYPRIAVTVDMIATGTDVKPLECVFFMRNVRSANYFEQMKGRGVRVVDVDTLRAVTPDATAKTRFVIVDDVGVCEGDRTDAQPLDRKRSVPLAKVLEAVAMGNAHPNTVSTLAGRLARLDHALTPKGRAELAEAAGGATIAALAAALVDAIDPAANQARARVALGLAPDAEPPDDAVEAAAKGAARVALRPFGNPRLRARIVELQTASEQIIDELTVDELLYAGHDDRALERARELADGFRAFIADNKDEIEALRVLYSRPYRAGLRFKDIRELAAALALPPLAATPEDVWQAFTVIESAPLPITDTSPGTAGILPAGSVGVSPTGSADVSSVPGSVPPETAAVPRGLAGDPLAHGDVPPGTASLFAHGDVPPGTAGILPAHDRGRNVHDPQGVSPIADTDAARLVAEDRVAYLVAQEEQRTTTPARRGSARQLTDLIALVRHAITPAAPLTPFAATVEDRYRAWLAEQEGQGAAFTPEQRGWPDAIRDHIAASLRIEPDDFDYIPFSERGGLGRVYSLFGERLPAILAELNERLVA